MSSPIALFVFFFSLSAFAQGVLRSPVIPKDNPQSKAKIELGKQLYFDPRLSSTGSVSCNSCHNVGGAGEDNRAFSFGVKGQLGGRSSPTVYNSAYFSVLFWDGRAASLEEQAKGPLTNPVEMGMKDHDAVVEVVKGIEGYRTAFAKVFGEKEPITIDNIVKAIASYERTLVTLNSNYDRCTSGQKVACSSEANKGFLVMQETGCLSCHSGPHFSGPTLPQGTGFYQKFPTFQDSEFVSKYKLMEDTGRFQVTKNDGDKHMWRVPSLRNVALTAPYFHNGSVKTLDEAVRVMAKVQLNKDLNEAEIKSIVAFLNTLTGQFPSQENPRLPLTANYTPIKD